MSPLVLPHMVSRLSPDTTSGLDVRLRSVLALFLLSVSAWAAPLEGRITDGQRGLPGVRIYPDRLHRVGPEALAPWALTDAEGRFRLELEASDTLLVVEKSGWQRDFVPRGEFQRPVVMRAAPEFRAEKALVVRIAFPDEKGRLSDDELRSLLFGRQPGRSSAANYVYEVSKGSLELEEGAILHLEDPTHPPPRGDAQRDAISEWVLAQLRGVDLKDFDRVDNRTGARKPDGKPDHLWIIAPGLARNATTDPAHLSASSFLLPLPWKRTRRWGVVFFAEETPLGNIVHELFHAMGEHRVDDLYLDCDRPMTAGIWDLMDAGQYRGWDRVPPRGGDWQSDVGYSPSHPGGWVRSELWYRGRFATTVKTLRVGRDWTGWLAPLVQAPGDLPQRLLVPDPRSKGCFWELNLRPGWGFDRGRIGNRWGPGFEGLVVAHIDPSLLSEDEPRGPVRVVDAHPGTPDPEAPRLPCGRWELDDAAFNLGQGEVSKGSDGPLSWEILAMDERGRMQVRVRLRTR